METENIPVCSLCWKPGVNFIKGENIANLKEFLAFYNILINVQKSKICDLCVEIINCAYSQYLNTKAKSNIFVSIEDLPNTSTTEIGPGDQTSDDCSSDNGSSDNRSSDNRSSESSETSSDSSSESGESMSESDSDSTYQCEICNQTVDDLEAHSLLEHPEVQNKIIGESSEDENDTETDTDDAKKGKKYTYKPKKCQECEKIFANIFLLRKHMDSNHPNVAFFVCKLCPFKTNYPVSIAAHIRNKHKGVKNDTSEVKLSPKKDKKPPVEVKKEQILTEMTTQESLEPKTDPPIMKETKILETTQPTSVKNDTMTPEKPGKMKKKQTYKNRKCTECGKFFGFYELNRHVDREHPGFYLLSCDTCGFKSNYGQTMKAHKRRQACVEYSMEKMFEC